MEDLINTPALSKTERAINTPMYPAINNKKGYKTFLYFDDHPDNKDIAAMLVVSGQGCAVVRIPSKKQPEAASNKSVISV
jgi:hypothetical protein